MHKLPSVGFNLGTADAPKYFDIPPILWTKPVRPVTIDTNAEAQINTYDKCQRHLQHRVSNACNGWEVHACQIDYV